MDSLELVRMLKDLSTALSLDMASSLVLDFPNVEDLAQELDRRLGRGRFPNTIGEATLSSPATHIASWDDISVDDLLFVQAKCNKFYALPQYQKRFAETAQQISDRAEYIKAIEAILVEVEGPIMKSNDLIEDTKYATVHRGRKNMARCITRFSLQHPKVQEYANELLRLTKQEG